MAVLAAEGRRFDAEIPIAIVGAGACGLTAALAARDAGAEVLVLEQDAVPTGSTSLSSGFIPAAPTRYQRRQGIEDSVERFGADIQAKAENLADPDLVQLATSASGPMIEWLSDSHGLTFKLLTGFNYPGHSALRIHATPAETGADLEGRLLNAAEAAGAQLVTSARVTDLYAEGSGRVRGLRLQRPDGSEETLGVQALVLACSGFAGDPEQVRRYLPEMKDALYFGHAGNRGDAIEWGAALGASLQHLTSCQGHGSVAVPHGILITWALIMEGAFQVNLAGKRFANEERGYSEQALDVLHQPDGLAFVILDERLHRLGQEFENYRKAVETGAIREAGTAADLALDLGIDPDGLVETFKQVRRQHAGLAKDEFGRSFAGKPPLTPSYFGVKVTGALFHTQGGLSIDDEARVKRRDGGVLPNLFAGGGAACGVSGPHQSGYLSGNGLLSALTLGRIAGTNAAAMVLKG